MSTPRKTLVIHDTDLHGFSCGVTSLYALRSAGIEADVYSHFSTNPAEPSTTPTSLASVIENLGLVDLVVLDIPVDIRNPKRYIDALVGHAKYKGRVLWADHHGHSQWVDELNRNGVVAIVVGTSYDLSLLMPRMYAKVDNFVERWALLGAVADFDPTVANRVSYEFEQLVCEFLDPVFKQSRAQLMEMLGLAKYRNPSRGNVGELSYAIAVEGVDPERVLEVARSIGRPIPLPRYESVGDVVYTTELPPQGLAWKTAWKLCLVSGARVAVVPAFNPRTNQYSVIVAKYWRAPEELGSVIDDFIMNKFAGRQIVGHPGARSVLLMSQNEISMIPQIARELADEISRRVYAPRTARLISEQFVAQALHQDFVLLLNRIARVEERLAELVERQNKMYEEYLELKRAQVDLLRRVSGERRVAYD